MKYYHVTEREIEALEEVVTYGLSEEYDSCKEYLAEEYGEEYDEDIHDPDMGEWNHVYVEYKYLSELLERLKKESKN